MRRYVASLIVGFAAAALLVIALPHAAAAVNFFGDACQGAGANSAACSGNGKDTISGTNGVILHAAALVSIIAAVAAVIVIMIAGIMFITAGGDANKVSSAKQMVTYAIVGLIVIFLARAIVVFVINNV